LNSLFVSAVQRGGNWNNGRDAGVFSVNLNNAPSNSNGNIGFRCPPEHQANLAWRLNSVLSVRAKTLVERQKACKEGELRPTLFQGFEHLKDAILPCPISIGENQSIAGATASTDDLHQ
jgi:hypothetical protein